jgi:hypothetical protein
MDANTIEQIKEYDISEYYLALKKIQMFYDYIEEEIYFHEIDYILQVTNSFLSVTKTYELLINDDILFHKTKNNLIYFVMTDSTIGRYNLETRDTVYGKQICSDIAKVIAFYAREDEKLLIVCSYPFKTELILSKFGNNAPRKFRCYYLKLKKWSSPQMDKY